MRRSKAHAIAALSMLPVAAIGSEDTLTEEIVVTASFTDAAKSLTRPVHVLSGEDLANTGVQSLGEHIDSLVGVGDRRFWRRSRSADHPRFKWHPSPGTE